MMKTTINVIKLFIILLLLILGLINILLFKLTEFFHNVFEFFDLKILRLILYVKRSIF